MMSQLANMRATSMFSLSIMVLLSFTLLDSAISMMEMEMAPHAISRHSTCVPGASIFYLNGPRAPSSLFWPAMAGAPR